MKITTFLFLLTLSLAGYAQKLDGNWKGNISTPDGDFELTYTFKVDGESLSGNVTSEWGSLPLENGKVNGNEFTYDINFNGQVMTTSGVLDGDIVKLSSPMRPEPLILTRIIEVSKIDGKWLGIASGPQGDLELTFTFAVDGEKLTGKNSSAMGETDLTNGVVNGNEFSFDVDIQDMKINHKCKYLEDDTIEVKAYVMDQEMIMKLTRVAQ